MFSNKMTTQTTYKVFWTEDDEWGYREAKKASYTTEAGARMWVSILRVRGHREAFYELPTGQVVR